MCFVLFTLTQLNQALVFKYASLFYTIAGIASLINAFNSRLRSHAIAHRLVLLQLAQNLVVDYSAHIHKQ